MTDLETDIDHRASALRREMVAGLRADGSLRSPEWIAAFQDVSRHVFVPKFYRQTPTSQQSIDASTPEDWLAEIYDDQLLLIRPDASSSSTMPSLMAVMLEALDPTDGDRVLEIGTGSGYNAALLCHRLTDANVTTLDIDAQLVETARRRLAEAHHRPTVVAGDGVVGWPDGGPYDRLIVTCAPGTIPSAWLAQVHPGGRIVVPIATGVAVLTVEGPDIARGRFLSGPAYFMPLRTDSEAPDISGILTTINESTAPTRSTTAGVESWFENGFQFAVAVNLPGLRHLTNDPATGAAIFWHPDGSWAQLLDGRVRQGGARSVWDAVEMAYSQWEELGRPDRDRFTLTVTASLQRIGLDESALHWDLCAQTRKPDPSPGSGPSGIS